MRVRYRDAARLPDGRINVTLWIAAGVKYPFTAAPPDPLAPDPLSDAIWRDADARLKSRGK